MIHYYFQWFQDKTENGKVNVLVCYVATLQAVKSKTHSEYIDKYHVISEPKTGVTLFSLAVEHARKEDMKYVCCDSTNEAVNFYLKVFNMQENNPFPDNVYHPMGLAISQFKYWKCLPYNSKDDKILLLSGELKSNKSISPKFKPKLNDAIITSFHLKTNYIGEVINNTINYLYEINENEINENEIIIKSESKNELYNSQNNSMELINISDNNIELDITDVTELDFEGKNNEIEKEIGILQSELRCVVDRNSKIAQYLKDQTNIAFNQYIKDARQNAWMDSANKLFVDYMNKVLEYQKAHSEYNNDDQCCDICFDDDSAFGNQIVFCGSCNVGVHQFCYNIPVIPADEWYCMRCSQKMSQDLACFLCGQQGGAFVPTDNGRVFILYIIVVSCIMCNIYT